LSYHFIEELSNELTMKKFLLLFVGIAGISLAFVKAKKQNNNAADIDATRLSETISCCPTTDDAKDGSTDASFMAVASTKEFGNLHEDPLPFELEEQLGSMTMFNCKDGNPGQAYSIQAKTKTNKYLIVIQEWWGLNDHIKQEAERFYNALDGKVNVLAVDLYDGKVAATVDSAQKLIKAALSSNRKETILQGALDYAGKGAQVYTVGWCFGGMMSLQTAIMGGDKMKACVMYYGTPEKDNAKIAMIKCDVFGIFGTQDKSIPNEAVDKFAADMKAAGKSFSLQRYDAGHAFANPSNPGYSKEFGDDAFGKSVAFLKAHMK
jgi:carboxymethylenebutenolidase